MFCSWFIFLIYEVYLKDNQLYNEDLSSLIKYIFYGKSRLYEVLWEEMGLYMVSYCMIVV